MRLRRVHAGSVKIEEPGLHHVMTYSPQTRPAPPKSRDAKPLVKADFESLSQFRYELRRFLRFSEDAAQAEGLTPLQYQLLLHIKGFPGREWASVGELAERLQMQQHGAVALVSRCESAGLVSRTPGKADRRLVQVGLTPAGQKCLLRLARLHRTELRSLAHVFQIANIAAFNDRPHQVPSTSAAIS
jgi:DNA-binding MarR family transcriptional regulator